MVFSLPFLDACMVTTCLFMSILNFHIAESISPLLHPVWIAKIITSLTHSGLAADKSRSSSFRFRYLLRLLSYEGKPASAKGFSLMANSFFHFLRATLYI